MQLPSSFAARPAFVNHGLLLSDVFAVTDRIVGMRRGRKVAERITARTNAEEPAPCMVGAREDPAA